MEEAELAFDRVKHVCYSPQAKRVMLRSLSQRFPPQEAAEMWEKIQLQYVDYLRELPYLGGRLNMRSGTAGTYDCIALLAFCAVLPEEKQPTREEFYEMGCALFLPPFQRLGKIVDLNRPRQLRLLNAAFWVAAKRTQAHESEWPADYIMRMELYDEAIGPSYRFEQCPLADFARENDLLYWMPPLCNADYAAMELLHGALLRRHTCANGDICDYRIVGDAHPDAKKYPRKTDAKGYWYNEV